MRGEAVGYGRRVGGREPNYREIVERIGDMIYTLDLEAATGTAPSGSLDLP